jgi:N-acetylneuraminate synthase
MQIAHRTIGPEQPPYLIAEMSANHNNSLERALAIVDAAAEAGADAIKLQTYTADTMTLDSRAPGFVIDDPSSLWHGRQLHELYGEGHLPWEWHAPIMERAAGHGLACFSSPFDETAVDFLEQLGCPAYKIASFELVDIPLIERVARTGKPMIMSTGMATLAEIDEAVRAARGAGNTQLVLLKCTSTYPATPENTNIATIPHLREATGCLVGLVRSHDGQRRGGCSDRIGRRADREALHAGAGRRRRRLGVFDGAGGTAHSARGNHPRLAGRGFSALRDGRGGGAIQDVPPVAVHRP